MFLDKRADAVSLPPLPQVLTPSESFDGDDGKWSTFIINIAGDGDGKGQNFKVLISTSSPMALVPAQSGWCNDECAKNRGIMDTVNGQQARGFDYLTAAWKQEGLFSLPLEKSYWFSDNFLILDKNISSLNSEWGTTTVGLGRASKQSNTISEQYVALQGSRDLFLGSLGLSVGQYGFGTALKPTFLEGLLGVKLIPSRSYGFTAGASYRNGGKGVRGNMVFGGYDKARLVATQPNATISMPNASNTSLVVGVQSITYKPKQDVQSGADSLTRPNSGGFNAIIDSTFPYLVLPDYICDQFVTKFNLVFDRTTSLYTINETAHGLNLQQNATVQIKIGTGIQDSPSSTTIVLPYDAFYLQASYPIAPAGNTTAFFPIKKSTNGVYVLGRTFLQEAYIVVDYERTTFTVAPAYFSDPMPTKEELVPIFSTDYKPPEDAGGKDSDTLSAGAIAGIVIGIVAVFLLLGGIGFWYFKKRRATKAMEMTKEEKPRGVDMMPASGEVKDRRASELTGSEPYSPQAKPVGYYGGDHKSIPELSPDTTPAELWSPPDDGSGIDYFAAGSKPRRRGATRDSSGQITPGTPVAELAGDESRFPVPGPERPKHTRGPSDTSLSTNIDEVLAAPGKDGSQVERKHSSRFVEHTGEDAMPTRAEMVVSPLENTRPDEREPLANPTSERRPSHGRGLSDTTVASDTTAVSQFTPEEIQQWTQSTAHGASNQPHAR